MEIYRSTQPCSLRSPSVQGRKIFPDRSSEIRKRGEQRTSVPLTLTGKDSGGNTAAVHLSLEIFPRVLLLNRKIGEKKCLICRQGQSLSPVKALFRNTYRVWRLWRSFWYRRDQPDRVSGRDLGRCPRIRVRRPGWV